MCDIAEKEKIEKIFEGTVITEDGIELTKINQLWGKIF